MSDRHVTILGHALPGDSGEWLDETFRAPGEVWGFNPPPDYLADRATYCDRWFELHDMRLHDRKRPWYREFLVDMIDAGVEVWTQGGGEDIAGSKMFPRHDIERRWRRGAYHCGSVDWLVSFAVDRAFAAHHQRWDTLTLAGMDYGGNEPESSRACLEYWVGVAEGAGLDVRIVKSRVLLGNWARTGWDKWHVTDEPYGYVVANWDDETYKGGVEPATT